MTHLCQIIGYFSQTVRGAFHQLFDIVVQVIEVFAPIADYWALYDNGMQLRRVAEKPIGGSPQIYDRVIWEAMVKSTEARDEHAAYGAAPTIMGVPTATITASMEHAVQDARRRHKALGHPIIIWRDGKVVEVPPEEIEI